MGMLSIIGLIPISTEEDGIHNSYNEMNSMMMEDSSQHRDNIDMNMKDKMNMEMEMS
jgi:hypothetical protein